MILGFGEKKGGYGGVVGGSSGDSVGGDGDVDSEEGDCRHGRDGGDNGVLVMVWWSCIIFQAVLPVDERTLKKFMML